MAKSRKHLIWIDCEMTGLDPVKQTILELAIVITNQALDVVAEGPTIYVKPSKKVLENMEPWSLDHHTRNGLLDTVNESGVSMKAAEQQALSFINEYCCEGKSPVCGNTIGHDRRFLAKYMPELHDFCDYRSIDVTSVKLLVGYWFAGRDTRVRKNRSHRAIRDILDSIKELRHYKENFFEA